MDCSLAPLALVWMLQMSQLLGDRTAKHRAQAQTHIHTHTYSVDYTDKQFQLSEMNMN